ncbi:MAG: hypothetical protein U0172_06345 [Nitrospiraceae bacterium]
MAGTVGDTLGVTVYAVGGIVRDLYLERTTRDVDLAVEGDSLRFARALAQRVGGAITTHPRFGTAHIALPSQGLGVVIDVSLDIAQTRTETYAEPAALPKVRPGTIHEDLARRDFTCNAMAIPLNGPTRGRLLDPFDGSRDLDARVIRTLHADSFRDDPTRIFRAVRFAARLCCRIHPSDRRAIDVVFAERLVAKLAPHRLTTELRLILSEADPVSAWRLLDHLAVLRAIHREIGWSSTQIARCRRLEPTMAMLARHGIQQPGLAQPVWLLWLAALLLQVPHTSSAALLARLEIPTDARTCIEQVRRIKRWVERIAIAKKLTRLSKLAEKLDELDAMGLALLVTLSEGRTTRVLLRRYVARSNAAQPVVTGRDLQRLGIPAGPQYRQILLRIRRAKLDGKIRSEADEWALVRQFSKRHG